MTREQKAYQAETEEKLKAQKEIENMRVALERKCRKSQENLGWYQENRGQENRGFFGRLFS